MGLVNEFKRFAMRGNVIDLAVGVVIGTAFGKIVSALVEGIIMPLAGALTRGVDLSELALAVPAAGTAAGPGRCARAAQGGGAPGGNSRPAQEITPGVVSARKRRRPLQGPSSARACNTLGSFDPVIGARASLN